MKISIYFILLSLTLSFAAHAQDKKYTDSAVTEYIEHCKCEYKGNRYPHDIKSSRRYMPFKGANKIIYISYKDGNKSITPYLKDGKINEDAILEQHTLNDSEINSLVNVLTNYGYKGNPAKILVFDCVNSEQAILFQDKNGDVFTSINLSFKNTANLVWSNKNNQERKAYFGKTCFGKYELIANLFKNAGLKYVNQ